MTTPAISVILDPGTLVQVTNEAGTQIASVPVQPSNVSVNLPAFGSSGGVAFNVGQGLELDGNSDLNAVLHSDGSLAFDFAENAPRGSVQVGVLATDAQHGTRGGGTQHAEATVAVAGFMSAADKSKLDGITPGAGVPDTRQVIAGAGLVGGGDLSADRTFDVVAADGSIVVNANDIAVGIISDAQHGNRSGGALHALATVGVAGFMSAADKSKLDGYPATPSGIDHGTLSGLGDNDHPQYQLVAEKGSASGYASLDGSVRVVEAVQLIHETGDPQDLSVGAIPDGFLVSRSGNDLIGINPASVGVTDHGALTGLGDDDHTQYLLVSGTRAMTGALDMGGFAVTNVGNVDGRDVSLDGSVQDAHIADATIHFTEASIDHTAIQNIGTNTHAQIDSHIADTSIHFSDAPSDGTPYARQDAGWVSAGGEVTSLTLTGLFNTILNLNQTVGASPVTVDLAPVVNLVSLQTAYNNGPDVTLDATPNPLTIQASVAGDAFAVRDVGGNDVFLVEADNDLITMNGGLTINDTFTNSAQPQSLIMSDTFTTGGVYLGGGILSNGTVTYNNSFFIWALMQESKVYNAAAGPGFAAFTLFNALPVIQNSGNFNLVQALVLNAGVTHARTTSGTSTTAQTIGLAFACQGRASVSGATLTYTNGMTAVLFGPKYSTVSGSTVNFGTLVGLDCVNPAPGLFQPSAGVETMTAYYGVRVAAIPFGGNVLKAALTSGITPATNAFFLRNTGGAKSNFGGGNLVDCGEVQIDADNVGLVLGEGQDVDINWNGSALEIDPVSGSTLTYAFGAGSVTVNSPSAFEWRLGASKFAFGQTSAVGNQVGVFVAPTRSVSVGGEWSDFLLTQAGNLTVNAAMSRVAGWTVNAPSITLGTGSVTNSAALLVGGNPNQGSNHRTGVHIISNPSGGGGVNAALYVENGLARFDGGVDINDGVALGGGAGATLGTIGGSGPTAAAQAQWLQIDIGGVTHWIPVWT